MHSSTSSSEPARAGSAAWRASVVFLTMLALWCVVCEAGARYGIYRISKIERAVHDDIQAALAVRPKPGGPKQLLAVGNSLIEHAVDREALAAGLAPVAEPTMVVVHQTSYYDWHFGIKKLLAEGSQPDAILLMLSPDQLTFNTVRGDYSASLLMQPEDVLEAGDALNLHPTDLSGLFFSTFSRFLGLRVEIRKVALGRVMPDVPPMLQRIAPTGPKKIELADLEAKATERLWHLKEHLKERHIEFIFAVHPPQTPDERDIFQRIAREKGVHILMPVGAPGELAPEDFRPDGFHLDESGKRKVTAALALEVKAILAKLR